MSRSLDLLYVSQYPPSPPRTGGQARVHGIMTALARRHRLTALVLADAAERDETAGALLEYCAEVAILPQPAAMGGAARRVAQAASIVSPSSFERRVFAVPGFQRAVDRILDRRRFDVVCLESPWLAQHAFRRAPPGARPPRVVLDEHNVEYDVLRQVAAGPGGLLRRAYNAVDAWKLRREERALWGRMDGITVTSRLDADTIAAAAPGVPVAVVPNAADVERLQPRAGDPAPDPGTVLFFGALDYVPNVDGVLAFLRESWPAVAAAHPRARLVIAGRQPPPEVRAAAGPRVEVLGLVDDLRPHLARAAVVIAPLRIGGGTRLKILEALAMGRPVVSTAVGAAGLDLEDGVHLLRAELGAPFATAVARLLAEPAVAEQLGAAGRARVVERYSWAAAARVLERFLEELVPTSYVAPGCERVAAAGGTSW